MRLGRENLIVAAVGIVLITIITTVVSALFPNTGMVRSWNDALFLVSTIVFCAGSISALVSKSRRHYYLHLKDTFAGKTEGDSEFEKAQEKRTAHAKRAVAFAISGILGIVTSAIIAFTAV